MGSIMFKKVKITSIKTNVNYYDSKKKKWLKYKNPKVTKKIMFEDDIWELGELYREMKNCYERNGGGKVLVSFEVDILY
jgi:hypothetical protein